MPEISVIVPVYNMEKYIHRCVNSILSQSFTDFELILVDDGSTDTSGAICDEYIVKDERIIVIHQTNQGQAGARNNAVSCAKGEWISFVDSDDVIHPQYLEILFNAAMITQNKIIICSADEVASCPEEFYNIQKVQPKVFTLNEQRLFEWFHHSNDEVSPNAYWTVWGKLIHKCILQQYPFTSGRIYEDNAVVCKWLYTAEKVTYCDNVLYYYYINCTGTTKSCYSLKRLDWLWAVREQIRFYEQVGYAKMEIMLRKRYVWDALRELGHIRTYLSNKNAEGKLRRHIILYCIKNNRKISLTYSEKTEIISRIYPKTMKFLSDAKRKLIKGCK